jgi:hypothetical protein
MSNYSDINKEILRLSLEAVTKSFDEFVGKCLDEDGKPKAPNIGAIMKARGCLPSYCKHSFEKKK